MPRKPGSATLPARELGIRITQLHRFGGEVKLRAMDPDARALLLKSSSYYGSLDLRPRGMYRKIPGRQTLALRKEAC